ncbi:MAG TPA: EF2563 family selenium-dependent molybdenum hydroxylase system protein [Firmicutes bacterium]|nr:EF2563 family selenium-dependent molybdenum hydroxylase system protein [Bacillota bacterium]
MKFSHTVIIKGAGDLASGVAHRLHYAGFRQIMLELPRPLTVRRTVSFSSAVYEGTIQVEGVRARLCRTLEEAQQVISRREIAVLIDPESNLVHQLKPEVLIDAIMAKTATATRISDAPVVVGLGPGFEAGREVHAVVETKRGHSLGKVYYKGTAAKNTGIPGEVSGVSAGRLLRASADGIFKPLTEIGDLVDAGEQVAEVDGIPVAARISGLVRGLLYTGLQVKQGMKVGDIDPRGSKVDFRTISDKARAVGGGVLEAVLHFLP